MPFTKKPEIQFDIANPAHVEAIQKIIQTGRLDSRFRFQLEHPFTSVLAMAIHKMAEGWMQLVLAIPNQDRPKKESGVVVGFRPVTDFRQLGQVQKDQPVLM